MKAKMFDELVTSVRQAGRIRRGRAQPTRRFTYEANPRAVERALAKPPKRGAA